MKILVVQTKFFGDLILSTPVFKALREIYPQADISVLTTKAGAPLIARDPLVNRVIPFDKRGEYAGFGGLMRFARFLKEFQFDIAYSLHGSYRTAILLALAKIPLRVGFETAHFGMLYHRRKKFPRSLHSALRNLALLEGEGEYDRKNVALRLIAPDAGEVGATIAALAKPDAQRVVVFPGSEWETKRWHWSEYRRVVSHYRARGGRVIILGSAKEKPLADAVARDIDGVVNLAGVSTLDQVLFLVKNATVVICNDSMALHTAAGFGVPVVSVFCATSPAFGFGPWMTPSRVVEKEGLSCKPCRRHGGRVCPLGTEECMRGVPAERVIQAADELLLSSELQNGSERS